MKSFCCGDHSESYTAQKVITSIENTIPPSRNISTFGKIEANITGFPTTYFPEQGFCQVLHTRNKYHNCLDMSKIRETPFKLTTLQPTLRKLADKHHCKVCINWNELFFWKLITFTIKTLFERHLY